MATQLTTISELSFAKGIDARSAENMIASEYVQDLLNADIIERRVVKRVGYQGYAGNLPLRVFAVQTTANTEDNIVLTFDPSVNFLGIESTPVVIYGRTSTGNSRGLTTTDAGYYFPQFKNTARKPFPLGTGSITISNAESSLSSYNAFVGFAQSTSTINTSNLLAKTDSVVVNAAGDITINYINGDVAGQAFVYYLDRQPASGSVYVTSGWTVAPGSTSTFTISQATHQLENLNLVAKVYQADTLPTPASYTEVKVESLVIKDDGDVEITVTNGTTSTTSYRAILSTSVPGNVGNIQVNSGSTGVFTIPSANESFLFPGIYEVSGADKIQAYPDTIEYDAVAGEFRVTFANNMPATGVFTVYWQYGTTRSNQISVTSSVAVGTPLTDIRPQLTLWGLDHSKVYSGSTQGHEGWVTHLDTYRREGNSRVLAGLGGNLFAAAEREELSSAYQMGSSTPLLTGTVASTAIIAPPFWETGQAPGRTRGYITGDDLASNFARITSVSFDGSNGIKYTLAIPNLQLWDNVGGPGTLSSIISSDAELPDYLTVAGMSYSRHNGTFRITNAQVSAIDTLDIWVVNPAVTSGDYDDTNLHGLATIATDHISTISSPSYIPGDQFVTGAFGDNIIKVVHTKSSPNKVVVDGVVERLEVGGGLQLPGARTSRVVPLPIAPLAQGFLAGDMISYTGIDRMLRVKYVYSEPTNRPISVVTDGTIGTVTLQSGNTLAIAEGISLLFLNAGLLSGVHEVTQVISETQFTVATSIPAGTYSGTLAANTLVLDEELDWSATVSGANIFKVETRWIPVEAPEDNYLFTPSTYVRHLTSSGFAAQPFLRSVMVSDNMYFTNGNDQVLKYDGLNIYRAGLPTWQPGALLSIDSGDAEGAGKIAVSLKSATTTTSSAADLNLGKLLLSSVNDRGGIPTGSQVRVVTGSTTLEGLYTVQGYEVIPEKTTSPAAGPGVYILLDRALPPTATAAGSVSQVALFKYYFRLNAVDANNNVVASAVTQYDDFTVELTTAAKVRIRLTNFPAWDNYDYDRIEVQVYRTKQSSPAPYYLLSTLQVPFDVTDPYIDFVDTLADVNLTALDPVSSTLKGSELGTQWSEPLRSKYITSAGNRLVLANFTDYPELDVQILASNEVRQGAFDRNVFTLRRTPTSTPIEFELITGQSTSTESLPIVGIVSDLDAFEVTTTTAHGLGAGHWVYLHALYANSTVNRSLAFAGWWQVDSTPTSTKFIIKYLKSPAYRSAVITWTSGNPVFTTSKPHNLEAGDVIRFDVIPGIPGSPTPALATDYRVRSVPSPTTFTLRPIPAALDTDTVVTPNYTQSTPATFSLQITVVENVTKPAVSSATRIPVKISNDANLRQVGGNSLETPNTTLFTTVRRLANAINAYMRQQSDPWLIARAGGDLTPAGRLILRSPKVGTAPSLTLPAFGNSYSVFVNGVKQGSGATVQSTARLYPSRLLVSYPNYPEIFDNPTAVLDTDSDSAIDINSADGQEITGVIPFFGESAFGGAQQSGVLVVFKSNSIYLVDLTQKAAGGNAVQKLETQGLGCTAPYSIAVTKNGIMFANESGMYCLRRDQSIEYIGRFMERNWVGRVERDQLQLFHGHHYGLGRQYKLSVPLLGESTPSEVYVYNHSGEGGDGSGGAWARYDTHRAIGWANLLQDAFWASTDGRVFTTRRLGNMTDYRDDNAPINFELTTRALDFGAPGIRKILSKILVHYRVGADNDNTTLSTAVNTSTGFVASEPFVISQPSDTTGIGDTPGQLINTISHSLSNRKGIYFQVKLTNNGTDENLEIAGMDFRVGGLSEKGILQAAKTLIKD
jgi:hypothetical protein